MFKRITSRLVLNFRVVMLVITSLALFVGVVSVYNQFDWSEPHVGLLAVAGDSFVHLTTDGSGLVERQSSIEMYSESDLFADNLQVLEQFEGEKSLAGDDVLLVSWTFDFPGFSEDRKELNYYIRRGEEIVESWIESFEDYEQMFEKVALDLGVGATLTVRYYPRLRGAEGPPSEAGLNVMARRIYPHISYYMAFPVGFAFLIVGFLVYFSGASRRVAHATHFFFICLSFYVLFVFGATHSEAPFNWSIFWANKVAFLFTPVVLLHFIYLFSRDRFESVWTKRTAALYLPSVALLVLNAVTSNHHFYTPWLPPRRAEELTGIQRWPQIAEITLFSVMVIAGLVLLFRAFRATDLVEKKKQLKWLFWGTGIGLMPTILFAFPAMALNLPLDVVSVVVSLLLIVMPACFALAIFRHKLMDVEVVFKRGFVYFISSFSVVALYFLLMSGLNLFGATVGTETLIIVSGMMILLATLFSHRIKDQVQSLFDRMLYSDFYTFRRTLRRFSQELSYERDLDKLLAKISDRIRETFSLRIVLIFISSPDRQHFLLSYSNVEGFESSYLGEESSRQLSERLLPGKPVAIEDVREIQALEALGSTGVRTLIPFVSLGEVIGFLALGNKADGDILNSDDLDLLSTLAYRAAISIDNALLYLDLENRAEELRRLKEFSENIVESVSSGICVIGAGEKVKSWNNAMEDLFGISAGQAIGRQLLELLPPPLPEKLTSYLRGDGIDSGAFNSLYKLKVASPAEKEQVLNVYLTPLSGEEGRAGRVVIVEDISDWVTLEDQLIQKERLASLGLLAAGVAHEVNTPLTGISSYIQMLQRRLDGDEEARKLLRKVEKQTFRASEIINSLLNLSRGGPVELKELDLNALIADSVALLENQLDSTDVRVTTDFFRDLPKIKGDRGKLQQVVINLLLNARDSMPDGGKISISTRNEGSYVIFTVADTGVGIPNEIGNRIFDPFFTTKKIGMGMGLGLAVSYGIVQEHAGTIEMDSKIDVGTKFTVSLPVRPRTQTT